tara:strand:+ start:252 stop:569 length:318 start_codon:yes stop_codon:yes gene_type:complete
VGVVEVKAILAQLAREEQEVLAEVAEQGMTKPEVRELLIKDMPGEIHTQALMAIMILAEAVEVLVKLVGLWVLEQYREWVVMGIKKVLLLCTIGKQLMIRLLLSI